VINTPVNTTGLLPEQVIAMNQGLDRIANSDIANLFNTYYPLPNTDTSNAEVPGVDGYYAYGSNDPYDGEQYTFKVDYNHSENHTFFVRYYYNHFKVMDIEIPHFEEQQKIANFLSSIDKSINNLQLTIDNSQLFKQGLLQKMFV